jgi:iron(III) transport system substrate-binding protein
MGITTIAVIGLALAGCGGAGAGQPSSNPGASELDQLKAAATKEGSVVIYTSFVPEQVTRLQAAWGKSYPNVQLTVNRSIDSDMVAKILQEEQSNSAGADVFIGTNRAFIIDHDNAGKWLPLQGPDAAAAPKAAQLSKNTVTVASNPIVMVWNTDKIKSSPKTFDDVLTSANQGKIGVLTPASAPVITAWWDWLRGQLGPNTWPRIAALKPRIYPSSVPLTQGAASGEIWVGLFTQPASVNSVQQTGAPVKWAIPELKQTFGVQWAGGALTNARHPKAAALLVNFLLSKQGQEAIAGSQLAISTRTDIPDSLKAGDIVTYDPAVLTNDKVKLLNAEWAAIFK